MARRGTGDDWGTRFSIVLISLIFIVVVLAFTSCEAVIPDTKKYEIVLEVHYPTRIDTVKIVNEMSYYPYLFSNRGSNDIAGFTTTAPIKVISIKEIKSVAHESKD